ncbi:hypothetical protein HGA64_01125 [Candidatus Falkowbacteria bacterium]|nr:hypothetical protein [Candidatus Falkowbacteria bacterium]
MNDNTHKISLSISGMHCRSCEMLLEEKLLEIGSVKKANVDWKSGKADIFFEAEKSPQLFDLEKAITEAGYTIGENKKLPWLSTDKNDYQAIFKALLIAFMLYGILRFFGLTDMNISSASNPSSLGVVLMIGLVAGFSTCMALVGGLTLGMSAKFSKTHPDASTKQKFRPHLYFNGGRILGYAFFGGLLGLLGSVFQMSATVSAILTVAVGLVMLIIGLQLTGLTPRLNSFKLTLPKSVSRILGVDTKNKEYSHKNSILLGATTFFLPCGFTQAMQLFAVSSGDFGQGALIMGFFALGTAPGLLSVGGLASIFSGESGKKFLKFAGTVVVLFSLFNLKNGLSLLGFTPVLASNTTETAVINDPNVKLVDGVQVVSMTETNSGYSPNKFTIKAGVPVRWEITANAPYSCASSIVLRKLGISKTLKAGLNTIKFTPTEPGTLKFSCSMGMYTGSFNVIGDTATAKDIVSDSDTADTAPSATVSGSSCGGSGGCGCGGGAANKKETSGATDTAGAVQVIKTVYSVATDIAPNTFSVKKGQPVRFEVTAQEDGAGCMSMIKLPGLDEAPQLLEQGKTLTFNFTPTETGEFPITCAMGMTRGKINVE